MSYHSEDEEEYENTTSAQPNIPETKTTVALILEGIHNKWHQYFAFEDNDILSTDKYYK